MQVPVSTTTVKIEHFHYHEDTLCCRFVTTPFSQIRDLIAVYVLAMFWRVSDLFFSSCECLQVNNNKEVNPDGPPFLGCAPSCCLTKELATGVNGCFVWQHF